MTNDPRTITVHTRVESLENDGTTTTEYDYYVAIKGPGAIEFFGPPMQERPSRTWDQAWKIIWAEQNISIYGTVQAQALIDLLTKIIADIKPAEDAAEAERVAKIKAKLAAGEEEDK